MRCPSIIDLPSLGEISGQLWKVNVRYSSLFPLSLPYSLQTVAYRGRSGLVDNRLSGAPTPPFSFLFLPFPPFLSVFRGPWTLSTHATHSLRYTACRETNQSSLYILSQCKRVKSSPSLEVQTISLEKSEILLL